MLIYLRQPNDENRIAILANDYEQFYARAAPFTTPLLSMLLLCSTYLTVLLSGDRYFLICWPAIAEKIRTRKVALCLILVVFIFVNIYILPHWFEYETDKSLTNGFVQRENGTLDVTVGYELLELTYSKLGSNAQYLLIYRLYLNVPITFVVPFTLLALCNGSMVHQLLLIKKKKQRLGHRMKADVRITIMLVLIVLTFMLCRSINLFVNLLVLLSPCLNKNSLQRYNAFANLLIAFNGFVNFFLFAAFGQRFREMVLYIFFHHGQHPFANHFDRANALHSARINLISTTDRTQKRIRYGSTALTDFEEIILRRRSSASMAKLSHDSLYNETRLGNHSHRNPLPMHIPAFASGRTSNLTFSTTQLPIPHSSNLNLSSDTNSCNALKYNDSSLIFIKREQDKDKQQTITALHVTCI